MKIGTIGSGFIVRTILSKVAVTEGIECAAVYSRKYETGKKLAEEFGVEKVYTDLDELCSDPELDFIYIASPNSLHYTHVKKALEHGKNVMCEKPFVPTAAEADELIALAKEKDLCLIEMITTLYHPHFAWVKEQMPSVGKLQMVHATFCQYSSRYDNLMAGEQTNIFDPNFKTGCLMDINVYNIYLAVALLGMPDKVQYFAGLHENGIDLHGTVMLQYGDVVCQCIGAKDTMCDNSFQLLGDKGYIHITPGAGNLRTVRLVRRGAEDMGPAGNNSRTKGKNREELELPEDQWFYEIQTISKLLAEGKKDVFRKNMEISRNVMEVMEKARKSAGMRF